MAETKVISVKEYQEDETEYYHHPDLDQMLAKLLDICPDGIQIDIGQEGKGVAFLVNFLKDHQWRIHLLIDSDGGLRLFGWILKNSEPLENKKLNYNINYNYYYYNNYNNYDCDYNNYNYNYNYYNYKPFQSIQPILDLLVTEYHRLLSHYNGYGPRIKAAR